MLLLQPEQVLTPFASSVVNFVVLRDLILELLIDTFHLQPPLWSSGQSSWLQNQRSLVRFPALPDFLRSSGSGTGPTQPREDN
jgi:hypothetical protein